jgi:hypothetical protein
MDVKDLINWGELSRVLAGSRQTVRKNKIPLKHQPVVGELLAAMEAVLSKIPEKGSKDVANVED